MRCGVKRTELALGEHEKMAGVQVAESVSIWRQTVMSVEDGIEIVVETQSLARKYEEGSSGVGFYLLKRRRKS